MNAEPHVHELVVTNRTGSGKYWLIQYGDQSKYVRMPRFRDPEKVLREAIRNLIVAHDSESERAGEAAKARIAEENQTDSIANEFKAKLAEHAEPCPGGHLINGRHTHKYCGDCGGAGQITKTWPSEALKVGE